MRKPDTMGERRDGSVMWIGHVCLRFGGIPRWRGPVSTMRVTPVVPVDHPAGGQGKGLGGMARASRSRLADAAERRMGGKPGRAAGWHGPFRRGHAFEAAAQYCSTRDSHVACG